MALHAHAFHAMYYHIAQNFTVEKLTNLTTGNRFVKKFSTIMFPFSVFPIKGTINLSKFYSSKFCGYQISSDFSIVKILRHIVYDIFIYSYVVTYIARI